LIARDSMFAHCVDEQFLEHHDLPLCPGVGSISSSSAATFLDGDDGFRLIQTP